MKKIDDSENVVMLMKQLEVENGYIFDGPATNDALNSEFEEWHHNVNLKEMRDTHSVERPNNTKMNQNLEQINRSQEPPQNRGGQTKVQQLVLEDPEGKRGKPQAIKNTLRTQQQSIKNQQKEKAQLLQRQDILLQLRKDIFGREAKTSQGNIICNAFWGFWPTDEERYINPKMEVELVVFKNKIKSRFEKRDVPESFQFPRIGTAFHQQLNSKYNFVEQQNIQKQKTHSQQREQMEQLQTFKNQRNLSQTITQTKKQYKNKENEELIALLQNYEKSSPNINIVDLPPDVQELVLDHLKNQLSKKSTNLGKIKLNQTDVVQIKDLFSPKQQSLIQEEFEKYKKQDSLPKIQNYVSNTQTQSSQYLRQKNNMSADPGYVTATRNLPNKKKQQYVQPNQNQMKKQPLLQQQHSRNELAKSKSSEKKQSINNNIYVASKNNLRGSSQEMRSLMGGGNMSNLGSSSAQQTQVINMADILSPVSTVQNKKKKVGQMRNSGQKNIMADKSNSNLKQYNSIIGRNAAVGPLTLANNRSMSNNRGQKNKNLSASGLHPPQIQSGASLYNSNNQIRVGAIYDTQKINSEYFQGATTGPNSQKYQADMKIPSKKKQAIINSIQQQQLNIQKQQKYLQLQNNNKNLMNYQTNSSPDKQSHIVFQSQNQFKKKQSPYDLNKMNMNLKTLPKNQMRQSSRESNKSNRSNQSRISNTGGQEKIQPQLKANFQQSHINLTQKPTQNKSNSQRTRQNATQYQTESQVHDLYKKQRNESTFLSMSNQFQPQIPTQAKNSKSQLDKPNSKSKFVDINKTLSRNLGIGQTLSTGGLVIPQNQVQYGTQTQQLNGISKLIESSKSIQKKGQQMNFESENNQQFTQSKYRMRISQNAGIYKQS